MLVLLGPVQTPGKLLLSKDFERPAWAEAYGVRLAFPIHMAVRGGISRSGRWLILGLAFFREPVMAPDGYTLTDSRGLEGKFDLRLYEFGKGEYKLRKQFSDKATWTVAAWSRNENLALLIGGPNMLTNGKDGLDKLYLLNVKDRKLRELASAYTLDDAKFDASENMIYVTRFDHTYASGKWREVKSRVTVDLMGRIQD